MGKKKGHKGASGSQASLDGAARPSTAAAASAPQPEWVQLPAGFSAIQWEELTEQTASSEVVGEVVAGIVQRAAELYGRREMDRRIPGYAAGVAKAEIMTVLELMFLAPDPGEEDPLNDPLWLPDDEPQPCPIDSWAAGAIPVVDPPMATADCDVDIQVIAATPHVSRRAQPEPVEPVVESSVAVAPAPAPAPTPAPTVAKGRSRRPRQRAAATGPARGTDAPPRPGGSSKRRRQPRPAEGAAQPEGSTPTAPPQQAAAATEAELAQRRLKQLIGGDSFVYRKGDRAASRPHRPGKQKMGAPPPEVEISRPVVRNTVGGASPRRVPRPPAKSQGQGHGRKPRVQRVGVGSSSSTRKPGEQAGGAGGSSFAKDLDPIPPIRRTPVPT